MQQTKSLNLYSQPLFPGLVISVPTHGCVWKTTMLNQIKSMFYFMSVHTEVILNKTNNNKIYYTNLPTGPCTISLTTEIIISVLYKMSLTLLQSLQSCAFFWNKFVVIGHSSSMCLTDRIFLETHVTFCEYFCVFHEFRCNLYITLAKYLEQEDIADLLFWSSWYTVFSSTDAISRYESCRLLYDIFRHVFHCTLFS